MPLHIDVLVVHFLFSLMTNSLCHSIFESLKSYNFSIMTIIDSRMDFLIQTVLGYSCLSDTCGKSVPIIFFSILKGICESLGWCSKIVQSPCLSSFNIGTKFSFTEVLPSPYFSAQLSVDEPRLSYLAYLNAKSKDHSLHCY